MTGVATAWRDWLRAGAPYGAIPATRIHVGGLDGNAAGIRVTGRVAGGEDEEGAYESPQVQIDVIGDATSPSFSAIEDATDAVKARIRAMGAHTVVSGRRLDGGQILGDVDLPDSETNRPRRALTVLTGTPT
jgi:hypothetical protein